MSWTNLVMWDNITFYYTVDSNANAPVSKDQLKEIKRVLNSYVNNVAYEGYIKTNKVNMSPEISFRNGQVEYNISAYPNPLPKKCPEDIFSVFPNKLKIDDITLTKKDWHAV